MKRAENILSVIDEFIALCNTKKDNIAFIFKNQKISYKTLLSDMYQTVNLMKESGLKSGDKALVFLLPSYELYLLLLASMCYGINIVVLDSYKSTKRIKGVLKTQQIEYIFCDGLTRLFKPSVACNLKWINVKNYTRCDSTPHTDRPDAYATVLTTFTSGTTNEPKPIYRSLADLRLQMYVVMSNTQIGDIEVVFSKLPIYTLLVVFNGLTCVISKKIREKDLKKHGVKTLLIPIAELLKLKKPISFIDKILIGGATLYPKEIKSLNTLFPNADINYVYGSSECVLIAKANLKDFAKDFAFDCGIQGVDVSIINKDKNGIGQICVKGEVVLSYSKTEISNDIGYIDSKGLHIVGRRTFSAPDKYNYILDRELLAKHPNIKKGFSLVYKEKIYFCYEGKHIHNTDDQIIYLKFARLPMDYKHKTKLNYQKVLKKIQKKYSV